MVGDEKKLSSEVSQPFCWLESARQIPEFSVYISGLSLTSLVASLGLFELFCGSMRIFSVAHDDSSAPFKSCLITSWCPKRTSKVQDKSQTFSYKHLGFVWEFVCWLDAHLHLVWGTYRELFGASQCDFINFWLLNCPRKIPDKSQTSSEACLGFV